MKENTVEIKVELVGYEELLEKLNNIKKLLQEIAGINIQVEEKQTNVDMEQITSALNDQTKKEKVYLNI